MDVLAVTVAVAALVWAFWSGRASIGIAREAGAATLESNRIANDAFHLAMLADKRAQEQKHRSDMRVFDVEVQPSGGTYIDESGKARPVGDAVTISSLNQSKQAVFVDAIEFASADRTIVLRVDFGTTVDAQRREVVRRCVVGAWSEHAVVVAAGNERVAARECRVGVALHCP